MLKFKLHTRRSAMLIAAVAATVGFAAVSRAANITWDPTAPGFNGNFNNDDANFWNPLLSDGDGDYTKAAVGDTVIFGGVGGPVVVTPSPDTAPPSGHTTIFSITLNPNSGTSYELSGTPLYFTGSSRTVITNTGNNTISSNIIINMNGNNDISTMLVNDTLTVGNIRMEGLAGGQGYGQLQKTGLGVLDVTGSLINGRPQPTLRVAAGTLILSGTGNQVANAGLAFCINVSRYATLAGHATVTLGQPSPVEIYGHLAPGHNGSPRESATDDSPTFGGLGTFSIARSGTAATPIVTARFRPGSFLDLDLLYPDFNTDGSANLNVDADGRKHDTFALTGTFNVLEIYSDTFNAAGDPLLTGASININAFGDGPLAEGTYSIITLNNSAVTFTYSPDKDNVTARIDDFTSYADADGRIFFPFFQIAEAPAGYDYTFELIRNGDSFTSFKGINLIVTETIIPEPASLGLLGLGCGLMLLRRKAR